MVDVSGISCGNFKYVMLLLLLLLLFAENKRSLQEDDHIYSNVMMMAV